MHAYLKLVENLEDARKTSGNFCVTVGKGEQRALIFLTPNYTKESESACFSYLAIGAEGVTIIQFKAQHIPSLYNFRIINDLDRKKEYLLSEDIYHLNTPTTSAKWAIDDSIVIFHEILLAAARGNGSVGRANLFSKPPIRHLLKTTNLNGSFTPEFQMDLYPGSGTLFKLAPGQKTPFSDALGGGNLSLILLSNEAGIAAIGEKMEKIREKNELEASIASESASSADYLSSNLFPKQKN